MTRRVLVRTPDPLARTALLLAQVALMMSLLAALATTLGGCTTESEPLTVADTPLFESGSRLRAFVVDAGGGAVAFDHFVDTELGAPCELRADRDGVLRCRPEGSARVVFADPTCTVERIGLSGSPVAAGTWFVVDDDILRVGVPIHGPTFEHDGRGGCRPTEDRLFDREIVGYTIDGRRRASSLVAFEVEEIARAGGLATRVLRGDDGSSLLTLPRDTIHDTDCIPSFPRGDDDRGTCAPLMLPALVAWPDDPELTDETCSAAVRAVGLFDGSLVRTPGLAWVIDVPPYTCDAKPYTHELHEVLREIPASAVHVKRADGTCAPLPDRSAGASRYLAIGRRIEQTELPGVTRDTIGKGSALGLDVARAADGGLLGGVIFTFSTARWTPQFRDRASDATCTPVVLDGRARCIPTAAATWSRWELRWVARDCTSPVLELSAGSSPDLAIELGPSSNDRDQSQLPRAASVRVIGDAVPPDQVRAPQFPGTCAAVDLCPSQDDFRALGAERPPETFPALVTIME